ncbi:autoinducer binding domain-containing protein [Mesorhizobium sp. 113-1-2]|uniref:autoinducer binding domain-containing protein n=1 Tax=Mesorhizobium sp. 113-1-2 TaxID=2744515 RepID=UPI001FD3FBC0|nr:autoinducer binding domain-containing protein [Mesorhizobium sp. 113-1-2]
MLKDALTDAIQQLGFDCYAYLNIRPVRSYAVSNYADEWQQRYLDRNYKDIDPVVRTARARMEAFAWAPESQRKVSSRVRAFYAGDCQEFCARGHDDGKERIITWLSRRNFWTSCLRVAIRMRFSPETGCSTI